MRNYSDNSNLVWDLIYDLFRSDGKRKKKWFDIWTDAAEAIEMGYKLRVTLD